MDGALARVIKTGPRYREVTRPRTTGTRGTYHSMTSCLTTAQQLSRAREVIETIATELQAAEGFLDEDELIQHRSEALRLQEESVRVEDVSRNGLLGKLSGFEEARALKKNAQARLIRVQVSRDKGRRDALRSLAMRLPADGSNDPGKRT
ncbi:hypothetical protein PUNSTDRAFT_122184 [Punctularia strigosozonata HHB-11173 SS5]|uniref:uncharacterized protein n=1 Tax=Punctularia strigosozonata (strain HHB-11173) TaxID=741275 RepID=UPI0004417701|nr:uncharacterized protein PUNSTDRAFT_122184 [Punctularia strigosozonata HHB-11173 SS5]EIN05724.1 hypothetical protein PUNSTDRAFT_122184 [Punctularia strigosozonata HHB-11173 SS5]